MTDQCKHENITIDDDIKKRKSYLKLRIYCDDCGKQEDIEYWASMD